MFSFEHNIECNDSLTLSGCSLNGDAVLHAARQQEQVLELQSFILTQDLLLDLLQLCSEPVNDLLGPPLNEMLLSVLAQRNLGRRKQEVTEEVLETVYFKMIIVGTFAKWFRLNVFNYCFL